MQTSATQSVIFIIFLIFTGTALFATLALFTRQSLLVAYIFLGALLGPWGLKLVSDSALIKQIGDIGIIFLLFLLGLNLDPQDLWNSLKKMSSVTFISSFIFLFIGFVVGYIFQFTITECLIIGITMMFSSTIVGLKLLPTTILHHQHTGELMISILLLQDIIAIAVILVLEAFSTPTFNYTSIGLIFIAFPTLIVIAYLFQKYVLINLLKRFDKIHEYIFILSIGWCLLMSEFAHLFGLTEEIGAFIAGIALATNPISLYISDSLRPLRDFFLVIFFFTIGAGFNFEYLPNIILPATILAVLMIIIKPYVFQYLLYKIGEKKKLSWEIGVRLGQVSEFSLLVVFIAYESYFISARANYMVQAITIITIIVSSYWVTLRLQTPLALTDKLRRD